MLDSTKRLDQRGFTITELLIAAVVGGALAVVLFSVTLYMYGGVVSNDARAKLLIESQSILRNIVDELRVGSAVKASNSIIDANEPAGGWTTSNDDLILIISTSAQDSSGNFIIDPLTGDPYQNEIIYYADNQNLLRRTLAHPDATGNTLRTNCPAAMASASCPADRVLTANFKDMNFTFYDQDNAVTTDIALARSIAINIEMARDAYGQTIEIDNQIRITLRNKIS